MIFKMDIEIDKENTKEDAYNEFCIAYVEELKVKNNFSSETLAIDDPKGSGKKINIIRFKIDIANNKTNGKKVEKKKNKPVYKEDKHTEGG